MTFARSLGEFGVNNNVRRQLSGKDADHAVGYLHGNARRSERITMLARILVAISFLIIAFVKTLTRRMYKNVRN